MVMNPIPFVICVAAAVTISACAAPVSKWDHPSATSEQWLMDKANCRSRARRKSEKEYTATHFGGAGGDDEFTATYDKNMQAFGSQRNRQNDYEDCLKRLGYTPSPSDK
jgi:hypothetical protein